MRRKIVIVVYLRAVLIMIVPVVMSDKITVSAKIIYSVFCLFVLGIPTMFLMRFWYRVEKGRTKRRNKRIGAHSFSSMITNAKFRMNVERSDFDDDGFKTIKGRVVQGAVKVGDKVEIYDADEKMICRVEVERIKIDYSEVKFASTGDLIEIDTSDSFLDQTFLPVGSVVIRP